MVKDLPCPDARPREIIYHLVKPLLGLTILETVRAQLASIFKVQAGQKNMKQSRDVVAQVVFLIVAQMYVAWLSTGFGDRPTLVLVYPLVGATFGAFFSRVRTFCEHATTQPQTGRCFVRSHAPALFDRVFFYALNMNYHAEHHLYLQVPLCNLPTINGRLNEITALSETVTSHSIVGTVLGRLEEAKIHYPGRRSPSRDEGRKRPSPRQKVVKMFKGKERPRDCRFGGERNAKHQAIQNGEVCRASHELHKLKVEVRRSLAENDVVGQCFFGLFIEGPIPWPLVPNIPEIGQRELATRFDEQKGCVRTKHCGDVKKGCLDVCGHMMEAPDNNACIELADPREVHRVHEIDFERFFSRECSVRF